MSWESDASDEPVLENWEDEDNDEPLLDGDDWDEPEAPKEAPKKAPKPAAKPVKTAPKKSVLDTVDPALRKQLQKQAELEADLNNAADLFDGLGVSEHPRAAALRKEEEAAAAAAASKPALTADSPLTDHPIFCPESKSDYEKLRKALGPIFQDLAAQSSINYSSVLAVDLVREICKPLSVENMRKVESTLKVAIREKEKSERQARLAKAGGTSTGGAGKKKVKGKVNLGGSLKKDNFTDTTNYDDFDDDDFM